jgi:hypothetical protein
MVRLAALDRPRWLGITGGQEESDVGIAGIWPHLAAAQVIAPVADLAAQKTHKWNISVQKALPFDSALTVSYVAVTELQVGAEQFDTGAVMLRQRAAAAPSMVVISQCLPIGPAERPASWKASAAHPR